MSTPVTEELIDLSEYQADLALTAKDRCVTRECGAQAWTRWMHPNGDLIFCYHHGNLVAAALIEQGFELVEDRTDELNVKPSSSANA